jgi:alcohol dehydrogenase
VSSLGVELDRLGRGRVVIATGRTLGRSLLLDRVTAAAGPRVARVFDGARQHVPAATVDELSSLVREAEADCVVSFGGGSPIDTAKAAIHALLSDGGPVPLHVAIPTTLSAGEFTALAGVTDNETRVKRAVADPRLMARLVIMDPELTVETPAWLWAASAVRALDHAVESIYSSRHHPLSDALASKAIQLLTSRLADSVAPGPDGLEHRGHCQIAAWMSVFGLVGAGFGLSHVLGHQIGPRWNVPHGITSCITLPHAMRFMARVAAHRFGPIAEAYGIPFDPAAPDAGATACADRTRDFIARLNLPVRLRDVHVPQHEIADIAATVHAALEREGAVGHPVSPGELVALLRDAY